LACFPVQYQESYYKDVVVRNNEGLCKFAYWNGFVVGAACARLETINSTAAVAIDADTTTDTTTSASSVVVAGGGAPPRQRLYIMTLGVLAAYRGRGIGRQLIQTILDHYETQKDDEFQNVEEISLHVQISNDDAIRFYTSKFGFVQGDMVENYYRRIDPPHCYLLYKKLKE
jgi:N-alpha-acetyltransferase 50